MKKFAIAAVAVACFGFGMFVFDTPETPWYNQDNAVVVERVVGYSHDEIIIERTDGNLYSFDGKGYHVGDTVTVTFETVTPFDNPADDKVIDCQNHNNPKAFVA